MRKHVCDWYQVRHDTGLPGAVDAHIVVSPEDPDDSPTVRQFKPDTPRIRAAVLELDAAIEEAYSGTKGATLERLRPVAEEVEAEPAMEPAESREEEDLIP